MNNGGIVAGIFTATEGAGIGVLYCLILMVIGMFMDITPAILIFTPIFLPIAQSLSMSDIQFSIKAPNEFLSCKAEE